MSDKQPFDAARLSSGNADRKDSSHEVCFSKLLDQLQLTESQVRDEITTLLDRPDQLESALALWEECGRISAGQRCALAAFAQAISDAQATLAADMGDTVSLPSVDPALEDTYRPSRQSN